MCQTRELYCMAYKPYPNIYKCLQDWQFIIFCKVMAFAFAFASMVNQLLWGSEVTGHGYYKT
jgi:hypothetical protein